MQIVINISDKDYEKIKKAYTCIFGDIYYIMQGAIANGTPLPKGHGRLIDADYKVSSDGRTVNSVCGYIAPTIIEAEEVEA